MSAALLDEPRTTCPLPSADDSIPLPESLAEWSEFSHIAALDDDERGRLLPFAFEPYAETSDSNRFLVHDESESIVCVVTVVAPTAMPDACDELALSLLKSCDEDRRRDLTVWLVESWMDGRAGTKAHTNRDGDELFSVKYGGKPVTRLHVGR